MDWGFNLLAQCDTFRKNFKKDWDDNYYFEHNLTTMMFSSRSSVISSCKVIIVRTSRTAFTLYVFKFNSIFACDSVYDCTRDILHFKTIKSVAKYLEELAQSL